MLYVSKLAAILVGLVILPMFNHLLGSYQFGIVAVIMSMQTLLLVLDLGMSTLVARDTAAAGSENMAAGRSWAASNAVITIFYICIIPLAWLASLFIGGSLDLFQITLCIVLFWALTLQNIGQVALNSAQRFVLASSLQLGGVLGRAFITLSMLQLIGATLHVFIITQVCCALVHWWGTHIACSKLFELRNIYFLNNKRIMFRARIMLRRGSSIALFGLAGAAVMQLDKPIVTAMASATLTAPYYLATVLCLTPISSLAGPLTQFFQPRIIRALAEADYISLRQNLVPFNMALALVTFGPTMILWLFLEKIVVLWLGDISISTDVTNYALILLPGAAIGALGYLPYSILVARQDFRFQALASLAMTLITLSAVVYCGYRQDIIGVCWVYVAYHCMSTMVSWTRCIWLERGGPYLAGSALLHTTAFTITFTALTLFIQKS